MKRISEVKMVAIVVTVAMTAQFAATDYFINEKVKEVKSLLPVPISEEMMGVVLTNGRGEQFISQNHKEITVAEAVICSSGVNWLCRVTLESGDGNRAVFLEWSDSLYFKELGMLKKGDLVRFYIPSHPDDHLRIERYRLENTEPPPTLVPQARDTGLSA